MGLHRVVAITFIASASIGEALAGLPSVAWDAKADSQSAASMTAPNGMAVDALGNVYVTADVFGTALTIKYDANGVEQWRAQENSGVPVALALDGSANVYVAAWAPGPTPGTRAFLTFKYDSNGIKQWQTQSNDVPGRDATAMAVSVDAYGNVYTSGASRDLAGGPWLYLSIKYDSGGVEQWRALADTFDTSSSGYWMQQAVDGSGDLTVSDTVSSSGCLTINYDPTGKERWRAACNNATTVWAAPTAILADSSGNVYLAARSARLVSGGSTLEFLTINYNANGLEAWRAHYPIGLENADAFALAVDGNGGVYVTGRLWDGTVNRSRTMTVKYSSSGALQWTVFGTYLLRYEDYAYGVVVDAGGIAYIGGPSYDFESGESNRLVVAYNSDGTERWHFTTPGAVTAGEPFVLALAPSGGVYTATQSGDPVDPSGIALQKLVESPTIFQATPNPSIVGQAVTLTAIVGSQAPPGTIAFREGSLAVPGCVAPIPVTGGQVSCTTTGLTAGTHSLSAVYGDATGQIGATGYLTQGVSSYGVFVTSSGTPSASGQAVTFTATVVGNSLRGKLDFLDGANPICTAVRLVGHSGSCSTSGLTAGTHSISARYSGDRQNPAATSTAITQVVTPPATTTILTSSVNPSGFGQAITLTAQVNGNAATGTIEFRDGVTTICAGVSVIDLGVGRGRGATCSTSGLGSGPHSLAAMYSGDAHNRASTSSALTQFVNGSSPTTTSLKSSLNPSPKGQLVTFAAMVAGQAPTGTVAFMDGGLAIAGCGSIRLSASQAACAVTLGKGTRAITAAYSGDANNAASMSSVLNQVVTTR